MKYKNQLMLALAFICTISNAASSSSKVLRDAVEAREPGIDFVVNRHAPASGGGGSSGGGSPRGGELSQDISDRIEQIEYSLRNANHPKIIDGPLEKITLRKNRKLNEDVRKLTIFSTTIKLSEDLKNAAIAFSSSLRGDGPFTEDIRDTIYEFLGGKNAPQRIKKRWESLERTGPLLLRRWDRKIGLTIKSLNAGHLNWKPISELGIKLKAVLLVKKPQIYNTGVYGYGHCPPKTIEEKRD